MSDERLPVPHGDQAPAFDHRTTSPMVRRGLARLAAMATAGPRSKDLALSEEGRPVLLWSFKGYGKEGGGRDFPRPPMLALIPEAIPRDLSERRQWVCWDLAWRGDKWGKPSISPITGGGPLVDPRTWGSFEEAQAFAAQNGLPGIGFVLSEEDPFTVVDLDECRNPETGELDPWALRIVASLSSYAELSPSGRGLHIIVRGALPPFDPSDRQIRPELYDRDRYFTCTGHRHRSRCHPRSAGRIRERYFACTGHRLTGTPGTVQDRQAELKLLLRQPAKVTSAPFESDDREALALGVAATDVVVVRTWDGWLRALDASTGAERWCSWSDTRGFMQIVRGVLYFSDYYPDRLTARDLLSGDHQWSFQPEDQATRNWHDEIIYVLDVVTGEERCRCRTSDDSALLPPPMDDVIYVSDRAYLNVLDIVDSWNHYERVHLGRGLGIGSIQHVTEDSVYAFSHSQENYSLCAVDRLTGVERWRKEVAVGACLKPWNIPGLVFYTYTAEIGMQSSIVALDAATGVERWSRFSGPDLITAAHGVICMWDPSVGAAALDATSGEELWSFRPSAPRPPSAGVVNGHRWRTLWYRVDWSPILTEDTAYVVDRGVLYALNIRTGRERWQLTIHNRIDDEDADPKALSLAAERAATPSVQVVGDMIYASTGYTLYTFREHRMTGM